MQINSVFEIGQGTCVEFPVIMVNALPTATIEMDQRYRHVGQTTRSEDLSAFSAYSTECYDSVGLPRFLTPKTVFTDKERAEMKFV